MEAFNALSDDAKMMCAAHFSMGSKTTLTFQTPWNVSPRATAALNEAVEAGVLKREVGVAGLYAHTYRAACDLSPLRAWMNNNLASAEGFNVMVPDSARQQRPPSSWPLPAGFKRHPK
ncbi:hypothetical protein [Brevundimonas sp. FT23028]|uniref:hypothetical protein n=1 Tax=Brevundimonas sp. FT23028 TaxID=3393748 RepID=UPI003B589026